MAYFYSPFRKNYNRKGKKTGCPFCDVKSMEDQSVKYADGVIIENKTYRWVVNTFPKFEGHTMVIPKRHVVKIGAETVQELKDREELITLAAYTLNQAYDNDGIEVFLQTGLDSEGSIAHLHWHVIPSNTDDPIRGFDKLGHFFTIRKDEPKIIVFPVPIRNAKKQLLRFLAKTLGRKEVRDESSRDVRRKRNPADSRQGETQ